MVPRETVSFPSDFTLNALLYIFRLFHKQSYNKNMLLYSARGQQLRNWSGYNWIWSGARDQESTNHSAGFVE